MRIAITFVTVIAAAVASYWYSYRFELQKLSPTDAPTSNATDTPQTDIKQAVALNPQPHKEHLVTPGDTLYSISKQYGLLWSTVSAYNQLADDAVIKPGMIIKIPLNEKGEVTRIDRLEKPTTPGTESWLNDPVMVVRRSAPDEYHFKNDDTFTITSLDYTAGTAMIEVVHDGRFVYVSLSQFTPGKGNGWYITQLETR